MGMPEAARSARYPPAARTDAARPAVAGRSALTAIVPGMAATISAGVPSARVTPESSTSTRAARAASSV